MKSSDLKPGDVIRRCPSEPGLERWKVAATWPNATADFWYDGEFGEEVVVLLKLERGRYEGGTGMSSPEWTVRTRTAWLEADAEVET